MIRLTQPARAHKTTPANGVILYRGPSQLDGQPIVAIATGLRRRSENPKTGDMIQVWILREDIHPAEAVKAGADASVCGSCPLRGRGCYVKAHQAPTQVWRSYRAGSYPKFNLADHLALFNGRMVRLGAYGDPAALPLDVIRPIVRVAKGWTGYTHQWKTADHRWRNYVMASCESVADANQATIRGYATFRSTVDPQDKRSSESRCPASPEAGAKTTCERCGQCSGRSRRNRVIVAHGSKSTLSMYRQSVGA